MGVYVYKINRRARTISGKKIHTCEFAFKCGRDDDQLHARYVRPMEKKWEESDEDIKEALFVMDYEDGDEVYRRNSVAFYDTGDFGEVMGHLRMNGAGKLRFEPEVEKGYKVTFRGRPKSNEEVGNYPDQEVLVTALNETRAKTAAREVLDTREGVEFWEWESQYPRIEKHVPPMTSDEALNLAMRALRKLSDVPLSDRVKAREILSGMKSQSSISKLSAVS